MIQDKEITELKELVPKPEDLRKCEKLEGEIKALKEEVAMLKAEKLEEAQLAGKRHSTHSMVFLRGIVFKAPIFLLFLSTFI